MIRNKTEDAADLMPDKDENMVAGQLARQTPRNPDRNCCKETINLTGAEWNVMECLWGQPPQTLMEMVALLQERTGWAKSTTATMLSRMEQKGILCCDGEKPKHYRAMIPREDAVRQETRDFLERVFGGSVGLMVNSLVRQEALSPDEISELTAILKKAEGETQ